MAYLCLTLTVQFCNFPLSMADIYWEAVGVGSISGDQCELNH